MYDFSSKMSKVPFGKAGRKIPSISLWVFFKKTQTPLYSRVSRSVSWLKSGNWRAMLIFLKIIYMYIIRNGFTGMMETGKAKSAVWASRHQTQESQWGSSTESQHRGPGEMVVETKAVCSRIPPCSGRPTFLFYSGLQLIGWGPPTLWMAICLFKIQRFEC